MSKPILCWEVEIEFLVAGFLGRTHSLTLPYYNCAESTARRRAMHRRGAIRIIEVRPVPVEEYERVYGVPGRRYG